MDHNEILKHVKALYEYNQTSDKLKNELAIAFPELRESEDAKIRKEFCKDIWTFIPNEKAHKYIAWLEKQGRDKEMNNFDVLPGLYKCVYRMFDGTPDGKLLFEVGNIYKCLSKHDRAEFEVSYGHSVYLEDPVVCKHFIPYEKQDEQKPAWSEEDEGFLNLLLAIFKVEHPNGIFSTGNITVFNGNSVTSNRIIDWIKDLKDRVQTQPHWKPSEEQMRALHDMNLTGNISYAGQGQVLIELYNDLEKL